MTTDEPRPYDLVASCYDLDMGSNMPFDDIGFYRDIAAAVDGPVLEVGCGTGRLIFPLLEAGMTVIGIDRSLPMLARLLAAAPPNSHPVVALMDARALAFKERTFSTIVTAYSLVTYLAEPQALTELFRGALRCSRPNGRLVIDAFLARSISGGADFLPDYRRSDATRDLERSRRITVLPDGGHRIERRYVLHRSGLSFTTVSTIRPYAPGELTAAATTNGWRHASTVFDHGNSHRAAGTRFATHVFVASHAW